MRIGLIGAGAVARAFARKAIGAGHSVVFSNSRGGEGLDALVSEFGPQSSAGTSDQAVANDVVLLATPWPKVEGALRSLPTWRGQILIDPTNAFKDGTVASGLADFQGGSSSQYVASLAPGARVVKAMNTLFMTNFAQNPVAENMRRVLFISGDDPKAQNLVADLFESFGFAPILLGTLAQGGRIQAVGGPIAGHDFFLPWPAPRSFPLISGITGIEP